MPPDINRGYFATKGIIFHFYAKFLHKLMHFIQIILEQTGFHYGRTFVKTLRIPKKAYISNKKLNLTKTRLFDAKSHNEHGSASVASNSRRTLVVLPIAELTNDELHCPLRPDEGAIAQRAVATDAIRPTHATHIRASTGTQKHAISIGTSAGCGPS